MNPKSVGIIGLGVMGAALLRRMQASFPDCTFWAATKSKESSESKSKEFGIEVVTEYEDKIAKTELLIIAVKPAQIRKVLKKIAKEDSKALVCSIAAGVTLEQMQDASSEKLRLVRAMPNTPCMIGEGVIALCSNENASETDTATIETLFTCLGKCFEVEERLFDAVTGLSGSGPAYMFLILEALADGGVRVGLPRNVALEMVAQTMLGSAKMAKDSQYHPAALRDQVTTPAGCTIGGLLIMEDGRIRSILARAIEEATRIASELGDRNKK